MARINRPAQPGRITAADKLRSARAVADYDKRQARERSKARIMRLAYWSTCVAVAVYLFYSFTK